MDLLVGEFSVVDGELTFMGLTSEDLKEITAKLERENKRISRRVKVFAKRQYMRDVERTAKEADADADKG